MSMQVEKGGNSRLFAGVRHVGGPTVRVAWGEPVEYESDDEDGEFDVRRHPSRLMPGSRVHARWSGESVPGDGGVPFVVEHPSLAVISLFFPGDPEFFTGGWGRSGMRTDDRIRFVLNGLLLMSWKSRVNRLEKMARS